MTGAVRKVLNDPEEAQIRYALRLDQTERGIKKGLQELCSLYENNRFLRDSTTVRQLVHSHLGSRAILLRRWSLKALGLIGHPEDTARIVDRLRIETDVEAQTWGAAALLKNADDRGVKEVCAEANLEQSTAFTLAARLYAPERWLKLHPEPITVSLNDDDLTLKWATFLVGYNRAPDAMFHRRHANPIFIGELNLHPTPEISEYSIWAMWERPEFGVTDLKIALDQVGTHPESVRKWLYRLMLKSPIKTGLDPDAVDHLRKIETVVSAREGLALGVVGSPELNFDSVLIEWFHTESDAGIRETLLVGIARRSSGNPEFEELITLTFRNEPPGGSVRKRLLAATIKTPIHTQLRRIETEDELRRQGLLEFYTPSIQILGGNFDMSKNNTTFSAGGDINGQILAGGDVLGSANAAVQHIDQRRENDQRVLSEVLSLVKNLKLDAAQSSAVAAAVEKVAADPKKENKLDLLGLIRGLGKGAMAAIENAPAIESVVDTVSEWVDL